jgi:uncharacterized protein YecE (DUF72 family)
MPRSGGNYLIGTSGWVYPHWRGIFYPPDLPQVRWFAHYAGLFSTVEINNTFYRLPGEEVFKGWREQAPAGFVYAIKASRYLTHVKRLKEAEEPLARLLERARLLEDHLGPVLYQLPPRWQLDLGRLEAFLALLPPDVTHVFEFRDDRWLVEPVFAALERHGAAFCIVSMPGIECPVRATAETVYIRFHGTQFLYGDRYSPEALAGWAEHIGRFLAAGRTVYAYFNNDAWAFAPQNALELREMVGRLPAFR